MKSKLSDVEDLRIYRRRRISLSVRRDNGDCIPSGRFLRSRRIAGSRLQSSFKVGLAVKGSAISSFVSRCAHSPTETKRSHHADGELEREMERQVSDRRSWRWVDER